MKEIVSHSVRERYQLHGVNFRRFYWYCSDASALRYTLLIRLFEAADSLIVTFEVLRDNDSIFLRHSSSRSSWLIDGLHRNHRLYIIVWLWISLLQEKEERLRQSLDTKNKESK